MTSSTSGAVCTYCAALADGSPDGPLTVLATARWRVVHGPPATTRPGGLQILSQRHLTDFCEFDDEEGADFGPLLRSLDGALREVTGAERVHLVSTRDRVQHFHAWLYPRYVADQTRGTTFLDAPQSGTAEEAAAITARIVGALRRSSQG